MTKRLAWITHTCLLFLSAWCSNHWILDIDANYCSITLITFVFSFLCIRRYPIFIRCDVLSLFFSVFLNVQGTYSTQIFSLAVLLSSMFIYNQVGSGYKILYLRMIECAVTSAYFLIDYLVTNSWVRS